MLPVFSVSEPLVGISVEGESQWILHSMNWHAIKGCEFVRIFPIMHHF